MLKVHHRIEINADAWSSTEHSRLLSLHCQLSLLTPVNECTIIMTYPQGIKAAPGDQIKVELGHNDELETIFTGLIISVEAQIDRLVIHSAGAARRLLAARLNLFFEKTAAGKVVADVCSQLDVPTGKTEDGLDLAYYTLGSNQSVAEHIHYLAQLCGFDAYVNEEDELQFKTAEGTSHDYQYGVNILALSLNDPAPGLSGVRVYGDSAASKQGTDAGYWIAKNAVKGEAGDDSHALHTVFVGAARTEEHTKKIAKALLAAGASKKTGRLQALGASHVRLGDTLNITKMPLDQQNGNYRVRGISHRVDAVRGFITYLNIESSEGAWSLSSLL